jgi:tetratricopeptide (TPR) repeat protein
MAELEEMTRGTRWRAHNLPQLARILLAAGEVERILQLLSNLAAATTRDRNSAVTAEALLAEARGDRPQALARYEDAAQRWGDFGFVLEHAHGLFGVARCLLVMNRGYEAIPKLNEARDLFAQLKARPSVMEVDRYLAEGEALTS